MSEEAKRTEEQKDEKRRPLSTDPPVTTQHQITIQGKPLKYEVTTGFLPLKNDFGEHEANIFFIAYTVKSSAKKPRPLMFSFQRGTGFVLGLAALGHSGAEASEDAAGWRASASAVSAC